MALNDEGHHCWRPVPEAKELTGEEKEEREEARVWLDGLDTINNCTAVPAKQPGISVCVDLSATPFIEFVQDGELNWDQLGPNLESGCS